MLGTPLLAAVAIISTVAPQASDTTTWGMRQERFHQYLRFDSYLAGVSVVPHWLPDGSRFWYERTGTDGTEIVLVDPEADSVGVLLGPEILSQVGRSAGLPFEDGAFPIDRLAEIDPGGHWVRVRTDGGSMEVDLETYAVSPIRDAAPEAPARVDGRPMPEAMYGVSNLREIASPDGRWFVGVDRGDLYLRGVDTDSLLPITSDGTPDRPWGDYPLLPGWQVWWSPDSEWFAVGRLKEPVRERFPRIYYPSPQEAAERRPPRAFSGPWYPATTTQEMWLFQVPEGRAVPLQIEDWPGQQWWRIEWAPTGSTLLLMRLSDRGQDMELLAVEPGTGSTRVLAAESADGGYLYPPNAPLWWWFLEDGKHFVLRSERSGRQQLYLYHLERGLVRQLTSGSSTAHGVSFIDEDSGWIYYSVHSVHSDPLRPQDRHLSRAPLRDGGKAQVLTHEPGQHRVRFSPSGEFFIDAHSSSSRPTRWDLRRADGGLVRTLEAASDTVLRAELGWEPPEEVIALASDSQTRLYGHLFKPWDFDTEQRYPVVDFFYRDLYASGAALLKGDWTGQVLQKAQAIAQLGFIVIVMEDRGSFWRGVDFRHSTWEKGAELEIADHVAVLKQLAADRPWMDLTRVGSFGFSLNGFFSTRALLLRPDFYKVGVSGSAPDVLLPKGFGADDYYYVSANPEGPYQPNYQLADRLEGRLLLTIGSEEPMGFANMMPLITGLVQAGKQYDLRIIAQGGHSMFGRSAPVNYFWDAVGQYFLEHLVR